MSRVPDVLALVLCIRNTNPERAYYVNGCAKTVQLEVPRGFLLHSEKHMARLSRPRRPGAREPQLLVS